jgi:predicted dehydrogenase
MTTPQPVRVVVLGCGKHARLHHLAQYAAMDGVEIAAVVDVDEVRAREAAEEFGVARWFTDHRQALEVASPDLVSIVSPPAAHRDQAVDSFTAGANVLCEKPIALSGDEAREMVDAAKRAGKFLSMGLQSRHLRAGRILREELARGAIGDVFFSRVWCGHIMNIPGWGHFHRQRQAGGGVVMATTVHILDFALWVLGNPRPAAVTGYTYSKVTKMREPAVTWDGPVQEFEVEDFAHALVRFENGMRMSVESNWLTHPTPRPTGIEYLGNDGRATLHPLKIEIEHGCEIEDVTPRFEENTAPVADFLREAVECTRTGAEPIVRPEQIVQTQSVMDAIYESARSGREAPVRL